MNIAFVFPGQGSQAVGMGKELYENFPVAKKVMDDAALLLDFDLKKLCFEGPIEELTKTNIVQPAITTINLMALEILKERGITPQIVAGHSLGEYSALAAAGVISYQNAIKLTALRGQFMQECADKNPGAMSAILGLSPEQIQAELANVDKNLGIVQVANFNSNTQSVISGNSSAVKSAEEILKSAGAKRIVPLPVSGPWHSALVAGSLEKFGPVLDVIKFDKPQITIIQNVTAKEEVDSVRICENLKAQITGSVQWVKTMELFLAKGIDTVIEVGPGAVLQGLAKAANNEWKRESFISVIN